MAQKDIQSVYSSGEFVFLSVFLLQGLPNTLRIRKWHWMSEGRFFLFRPKRASAKEIESYKASKVQS